MNYFQHPYASNSNIKEVVDRSHGKTKPDNIEAIFSFGTTFHDGILLPHLVKWDEVDKKDELLIKAMHKSFWADDLCRKIMEMYDLRREHEFYRPNRFGLKGAKCKCDAESRMLGLILELKGLSVNTQNAFEASIEHLGYDQGAAWYLPVASGYRTTYQRKLIVGLSKKDPERPPFKMLIDRDHILYKHGVVKRDEGIKTWKSFGFE